jgi:AraC-like DNA-binding protein
MTVERHLVLQEMILLPSAEWSARAEGWLVLRIAEGAGYWLTPVAAQDLNTGDLLVSPRNSNGLVRASGLGPVKLQYFFIQPRLLNGVLAIVDGQQLEAGSANSSVQTLIWPARDPLAQRFAEITVQPARAGLPLRCRLLQVWADAVAGFIRNSPESPDPLDLRDRFRLLLNQMSQAELSACSLSDLAAQLHCSERHLSRLFRAELGTPFRDRQTELRLLRAQQILEDSNTKIINVAYESGYRHLGLFNTMFKKRFGMTPSQWRLKAARKTSKTVVGILCLTLGFGTCPAVDPKFTGPDRQPVLYLGTPATPEAIARAREALHQKLLEPEASTSGKTNQAAASANDPGPKFEVRSYDVRGNTLLRKDTITTIFADARGTNVSLAQIRSLNSKPLIANAALRPWP